MNKFIMVHSFSCDDEWGINTSDIWGFYEVDCDGYKKATKIIFKEGSYLPNIYVKEKPKEIYNLINQ